MNRKNPEMSFERTGIKGGSKFTARSSLFGGPGGANGIRSSTSASTSVGSQYSTEYDEQVQALQEQENDQHLEKLKQGVEYLGQISIKIGDEIRDQNRLLDQMDRDMNNTSAALQGTMQRLNKLIETKTGRHMCYLVVFVVVVFFVLWYMYKLSRG
eukprot:GEZU01023392.1.p1 GENE.GEZU01023392.1~~GEZU01023392.1.p1  ORF type:complete len:156 (-),score=17.50 GEZU01023392.1:58-525(-)